MWLAIIDLDHFKRINDTYSHECGDDVLRRVAEALQQARVGEDALIARLGGEEFVYLCGDADREEALRRAGLLLQTVQSLALDEVQAGLRVTASIGIAHGDPAEPPALLKAADRCLYAAKRLGRNRIVMDPQR